MKQDMARRHLFQSFGFGLQALFTTISTFFLQHFPPSLLYFTADLYHLFTLTSPGCAGLLREVLQGREFLPRPRLTEKQKITGVCRQCRTRPAAMAAGEQAPLPLSPSGNLGAHTAPGQADPHTRAQNKPGMEGVASELTTSRSSTADGGYCLLVRTRWKSWGVSRFLSFIVCLADTAGQWPGEG